MVGEKVQRALAFATERHAGQKRIGGDDYITHPIAVYEMIKGQGFDEDYQIVALFHDLLEDTPTMEEEILRLGNEEILAAVKALTKKKGYVMAEYMAAIKGNKMALAIKAADRLHNLQCAVVANEDFKKKYVLETVEWYLDFSDEIKRAVKALAESMQTPVTEFPFLYTPVETWNR